MNLEFRHPRQIGPWPKTSFTPPEPASYVCDNCGNYCQEIERIDGWQLCEQCANEYRETKELDAIPRYKAVVVCAECAKGNK